MGNYALTYFFINLKSHFVRVVIKESLVKENSSKLVLTYFVWLLTKTVPHESLHTPVL